MSIYGETPTITIDVDAYARSSYVDNLSGTKVSKSGDNMSGVLNMGNNKITALTDPKLAQDAAIKNYVDNLSSTKVSFSGDTMTGALSMSNNRITDLGNPTSTQDGVSLYYLQQLGIPKIVVTNGTLPTNTNSDIAIYTLPSGKTVANGKVTIIGLWVESTTGYWMSASCDEFATNWGFFNIFTRWPTILAYYTSILSGWSRNYRLCTAEFE